MTALANIVDYEGENLFATNDKGLPFVANDNSGRTFTYDVENRLISFSGGGSGSFEYDPNGNLVKQTINGTETRFQYNDGALIAISGTGYQLHKILN